MNKSKKNPLVRSQNQGLKALVLLLTIIVNQVFTINAEAVISAQKYQARPKLYVVLVIDQFRADYLTRFEKRFLPAQKAEKLGGFQYLMHNGAYFPTAKYDVLQSMTCPGHAMILTGSLPYQNGISLNDYYDKEQKKNIYCAHDDNSPLIGSKTDAPVSPKNLKSTTFSDELKNAGYKSKVIALALKDRAAIMLGGHRADIAIWLDKDYNWVTSKYYAEKLPAWLEKQNEILKKTKDTKYVFKSEKANTGLTPINDPFERETTEGDKNAIKYPHGVKLTADLAIAALKEYKLGRGSAPDVLAVSFSSHDLLGHETSLLHHEMEELTIAEDMQISNIINAVKKEMGSKFKDVVFVLTADHGVASNVKSLKEAKVDAGYIKSSDIQDEMNKKLEEKFGKISNSQWIEKIQSLNFYLNTKAAEEKEIDIVKIENFLKAELKKNPAAVAVFTRHDVENKTLPAGQHERQILKSYNNKMSGDVIMIPKPYYMEDYSNTTHMTGYNYDRTVPLIIAGPNIKAGVYAKEVQVIDLAPTLSFMAGTVAPSLSEGQILHEIF